MGSNMVTPSRNIHAEISVLNNYRNLIYRSKNKYKYKYFDLIVIRINKSGSLLMSKPCYHCIKNIQKFTLRLGIRIRNCIYSNEENSLTNERFINIYNDRHINKHISRGNRIHCNH